MQKTRSKVGWLKAGGKQTNGRVRLSALVRPSKVLQTSRQSCTDAIPSLADGFALCDPDPCADADWIQNLAMILPAPTTIMTT